MERTKDLAEPLDLNLQVNIWLPVAACTTCGTLHVGTSQTVCCARMFAIHRTIGSTDA